METIPSKENLEMMLQAPEPAKSILTQQVKELIKQFKLPYSIEGDRIIELGDSTEAWLGRFITQDVSTLELKEDVRKLSKINDDEHQLFSILISGETGTGKELIARALHGDRPTKFLGINCAGLPDNLIESELFGHEAGSFTGANKRKQGLMKAVGKGGTLFLDEICELPMSVQGKLLRAIQSKTIRKVGAEEDEDIDCRLVCATNKNLHTMTEKNQFRLDLFARISTFHLYVAPLSERIEDKELILQSLKNGKEFIDAWELKNNVKVHNIETPLNVRSLQQYVKRFNILGKI